MYSDSDGNLVFKNASSLSLSLASLELTLSHERTDALGFQGHQSADQVLAEMSRPWSETISGSAGLGFARMG
jgi:hypothetical protein